jgi:hypothetical protein
MVSGLIRAGVIDTPFEIERRYRDRRLTARIEADGSVTCDGRIFGTLSSAASYARSTCSGAPAASGSRQLSSNGWSFWQYRNDAGELESIRALRRRYLRR